MEPSVWLTFFVASWAISISPGAGAVAAMSAGLAHGFARGYWLTFGLILGLWSQLVLVGAGVGALIAASSTAFAVVKWLGVGYLLWLGVAQWRSRATVMRSDEAPIAKVVSRRALMLRGWALNTVNPKGTLFMLAIVPQFIDPARPLLSQYAVIAGTLAFTDLVINAGYTAFAARVLSALRTPARLRWLNRFFGGLFIGLAALLATVRRGL